MNPRNLVVRLRQSRPGQLPTEPPLIPLVGRILAAGGGTFFFVPGERRLRRQSEFPDPGDTSGDPYGGIDLVFGVPGGLVEEGRSEG